MASPSSPNTVRSFPPWPPVLMRSLPFFARARNAAPRSAGPSASAARAATDKFRSSSSLSPSIEWFARFTVIKSSSSSAPSIWMPKWPPPARLTTPRSRVSSAPSSSDDSEPLASSEEEEASAVSRASRPSSSFSFSSSSSSSSSSSLLPAPACFCDLRKRSLGGFGSPTELANFSTLSASTSNTSLFGWR